LTALDYTIDNSEVKADVEELLSRTESEIDQTLRQKFESNRLFFKRVRASGVKNVELIGKNDLFLQWCTASEVLKKSETKQDCGADAEWDLDESFSFNVSSNVRDYLTIAVFDANTFMSNTLIGEAHLFIPSLWNSSIGEEKVLTIPVVDKNTRTGILTVTVVIMAHADGSLVQVEEEVKVESKAYRRASVPGTFVSLSSLIPDVADDAAAQEASELASEIETVEEKAAEAAIEAFEEAHKHTSEEVVTSASASIAIDPETPWLDPAYVFPSGDIKVCYLI
jgi:hypothetical protein